MNGHLLLIAILLLGIVPQLGFFSFGSFVIMVFFGIASWIILRKSSDAKEDPQYFAWSAFFMLLVSAMYYGGIYQDHLTRFVGQILFFVFCLYVFLCIINKWRISSIAIIAVFLTLSALTIYGSPNPSVDSFVLFKEAPQKFLQGLNPYDSWYSKVYKDVDPHYYNLLPFSIIYFLPFIYIFNDPRFGIIAAMLGTYFVINTLQKRNEPQKFLFSSLFLFAPRSFYMLEHAYLDTVIFFLIVLGFYFQKKKSEKLFAFIISSSFLFKQNIAILIPLFLKKICEKKSTVIVFFIPFLSVLLFFIWNPQAFFRNIITFNRPDGQALLSAPFQLSLTIPSALFHIFSFPLSTMPHIFFICGIFGFGASVYILFDSRLTLLRKIVLLLFIEYMFSYHAFYNSYFLIFLFLLLDSMRVSKIQNL